MSYYRRINGWYLDHKATEIWIRDPDHRVANICQDELEAIEWANSHNDHVRSGNHARGWCGIKKRKYERRL